MSSLLLFFFKQRKIKTKIKVQSDSYNPNTLGIKSNSYETKSKMKSLGFLFYFATKLYAVLFNKKPQK